MPAQLIDGKAVAARVRSEVKTRAERFAERWGRPPGLEVLLVGDDPASHVYVRNKERAALQASIRGAVHRYPADASEAAVLRKVEELNRDDAVDGILVQLPLPSQIDAQRVLDVLDPSKDVDGLHPTSAGLLLAGRPGLRPCTPLGCMELLRSVGCELRGKRAVVVGRSALVGKPAAFMLLEQHATVTLAHSRTRALDEVVRSAEVIIAAVGKARLVRGSWVAPGAVVIDVGINRLDDGTLCGDVDTDEARERASYITPVPGGVGPMTIAMLLSNTVDAAERRAAAKAP